MDVLNRVVNYFKNRPKKEKIEELVAKLFISSIEKKRPFELSVNGSSINFSPSTSPAKSEKK